LPQVAPLWQHNPMQKPRLANVRWFSEKPRTKRGRRSTPRQIVALRLNDLARLFRARYGITLPNDDSGRDDIELVADHLASLPQAARKLKTWCEVWAPWLTVRELNEIAGRALASPKSWSADRLAWRLRLTKDDRMTLGITTIGAVDMAKAARTKRRKERDRNRKRQARSAAGAKSRAEYRATSLSAAMPWLQEGISRAQWYRRRKRDSETGPATA
jgi:hypothetical protein